MFDGHLTARASDITFMIVQTNIDRAGLARAACGDGLDGLVEQLTGLFSPRFFKALCDSTRVGILVRLAAANRPCTVSEVARQSPVDLSVVSRHLGILRDAGILTSEKRGREVYYAVEVEWVVRNLRGIADAIERNCIPEQGLCGFLAPGSTREADPAPDGDPVPDPPGATP